MARVKWSAMMAGGSGRVGNEVIVRRRGGTVLRSLPTPKYKQTPKQVETTARFRRAAALWNALKRAEADQWNAFARILTRKNELTGETYEPSGQQVFTGLTTKFLQIDPTAEPPKLPPAQPWSPVQPQLEVTRDPSEPAAVAFTAQFPNAPDQLTELLIQVLPNPRRSPTPRYVTLSFEPFPIPGEPHVVVLEPGVYAFASRVVNPSTGETTELVPLGVLELDGVRV